MIQDCSAVLLKTSSLDYSEAGSRSTRVRRVKCDETKPFCLRCTKFGRQCDGYEPNVKSPKNLLQPKALVPACSARVTIPPTPRRENFNTEQEHAYFRLFCERTSITLAGDFDKSLWNRVILQACEEEPALRHGVIALGALDKTWDATTMARFANGYRPDMAAGDVHHTFALQQYGKSVRKMRENIARGNINMRKTLIGCLLAVCFESFHGNTQAAMLQARSGLKLINDWLPNFSARSACLTFPKSSPSIPLDIDDELILAFNRLDINTVSFIYGPPITLSPSAIQDSIAALPTMPAEFSTLEVARHCMEQVMRTSIHWCTFNSVRNGNEDEPVWDTTADPPWVTSLMWTDYQRIVRNWDHFIRLHHQWWAAAQPLFAHARTPAGHKELSTAIAVELRFRTCYIAFSNVHGDTKEHIASLLDPKELLNLAESLNARRKAQRTEHNSAFIFDGPFIGSLHVVTQKARDIMIRRRAIELLESRSRREGLWDSSMVAKLATLSLQIEEEGKEPTFVEGLGCSPKVSGTTWSAERVSGSSHESPTSGHAMLAGEIPEHASIQASRTTFDLQRKAGTLQYRTRVKRPGTGYNYGRVEFTW